MSDSRTYQMVVQDTGALSSSVEVGNEPNCLGWELSFSAQQFPGMVLETTVLCRDSWQGGGAGISFGPFRTTEGGKLFVPYPALQIQAQDFEAGGAGNSSILRLLARPVLSDGWSAASSLAVSVSDEDLAPNPAVVTFNVPPMAVGYKITSNQIGPLRVSLFSAAGNELSFWEIANPSDTPFAEGGQIWRETSDAGSTITVTNGGAVGGIVSAWFLFDFRRVK